MNWTDESHLSMRGERPRTKLTPLGYAVVAAAALIMGILGAAVTYGLEALK